MKLWTSTNTKPLKQRGGMQTLTTERERIEDEEECEGSGGDVSKQ
jgi:hypothetical protein